ncbi:MAG TPA: hypothetical protein VM890_06235 [Longimicrobium sp.]|nr:hypothetical protein [Longimicrobium sp.]
MTDRIQVFIEAGRLARDPAPDDEVVGLWAAALEAFADGSSKSISGRGRLGMLYDAGRVAADALVRAHNSRVRATNHHEVTIRTASLLAHEELARAFGRLDGLRTIRAEAKYGWQMVDVTEHLEMAAPLVGKILELSSSELTTARAHLEGRFAPPK